MAFAKSVGVVLMPALLVCAVLVELMSSPLDTGGKPQMGIAQFLMLNAIGLLVYGMAIARIYGRVTVGQMVHGFPEIPAEVLALMGLGAGGKVVVSAVSL